MRAYDAVTSRLTVSPTATRILGLFLAVRLATLLVAWLIGAARPELGITEILTDWDGNWNEFVANDLYRKVAVGGIFTDEWMMLAFLPVLPVTTHVLHVVTGVGVHILGPLVSMSAGALGFFVLGRYLSRRFGERVALAAAGFMLVSPNAFVLSMFYTEGPTILFVALTFEALDRRRWVRAGVWALIGGITRPNGFLLFVPCLIAAVVEIRRHGWSRARSSLLAPLLAPIGFVGWLVMVWVVTGEPGGYFRLQEVGWGARFDAGEATLRSLGRLITGGDAGIDERMNVIALFVIGVGGIVLALRKKLDPVLTGYAIAVVVLALTSARQASGARFLLPAFPLFVAWAMAIPRRHQLWVGALLATTMGSLFVLSITGLVYTP